MRYGLKETADLLFQRDEVQIQDETLLRFLDTFPTKRRFTVQDLKEELVRWMKVEMVLGPRRRTLPFLIGKKLLEEDTERIAHSVVRKLQRILVDDAKRAEVHEWVSEAGFAAGVKVPH